MGLNERYGQQEGLFRLFPRQFIDFVDGGEGDVVVIVDAQTSDVRSGLENCVKVGIGRILVVQFFVPATRLRAPAEIRRHDIRGQTLLEPVNLVRPDEMHLARQTGSMSGETQIVRKRRDASGKLRSIVIDTHF